MHAYLIVAHKNPEQLKMLLSQIDDKRNDIYILIDKKASKLFHFDFKLKTSRLFFLKPKRINWGAYSQIDAYLYLFNVSSSKFSYDYYHLLSGQDLLLKSQDYIHNFFEKNNGAEFINFVDNEITQEIISIRLSKYHFFQEKIGNKKESRHKLFIFLNRISMKIQTIFGVNRIAKSKIQYRMGENWCSLTNGFVEYLMSKKRIIKKTFKFSLCADEVFLQTIIFNSDFYNNVSFNNLRYIDWERGKPFVFTNECYRELVDNQNLFARKFDISIDREIIEKIVSYTKR